MKITKELLMIHNPCSTPERIAGFLACFPDGIVTLEGVLKAKTYNLDWVAEKLLPPTRWAEYRAKTAPQWAEYRAKRDLLLADYDAKRDLPWADYDAKIALLFYEAFREEEK